MATLSELVASGSLHRISLNVTAGQCRREIFAFPEVVEWIKRDLPELEPIDAADEKPLAQVWVLFREFILGHEMADGDDYKLMYPHENDVYELRSYDARIYGWFVNKGIFIAVSADSMERVHTYDLDGGYRNQVEHRRASLDLDPPKYVAGATKEYVFSV